MRLVDPEVLAGVAGFIPMNSDLLKRLIALSRKTGDRLIVTEGDSAFVLLPLEQYENLASPARIPSIQPEKSDADDYTETMNREVAALKQDRAERQAQALASVLEDVESGSSEDQFYLEPVE